jgi:hypothetical protein
MARLAATVHELVEFEARVRLPVMELFPVELRVRLVVKEKLEEIFRAPVRFVP